jgi:two-component system response regulator AtoC
MSSGAVQKILVFSFDASFAHSLTKVLGEQNYLIESTLSLEEAKQRAKTKEFNLAIFDAEDLSKFEKESGEIFQEINSETFILLINPSPYHKRLAKKFAENRSAFLFRPFNSHQITSAVRSLLSKERLIYHQPPSAIIGESEPMRWLKGLISRVSPLDNHLLIIGPSGSGKNLVADEIQERSSCVRGPYIKIGCTGVPENLLYRDIFGNEKEEVGQNIGDTPGKIQLANHGTLLLDEIGELPLNIQGRLVTALEGIDSNHRTVGELGRPDVRVIATSKLDIPSLVEDNKFREDLYFRLNLISVHVPPLRQRLEDLPLLIESFLPRLNQKLGTTITGVSTAAIGLLCSYHWPGNVRELGVMLERAALFEVSNVLQEEQIQKAFQGSFSQKHLGSVLLDESDPVNTDGIDLRETLEAIEKRLIEKALLRTKGIQTQAAKLLGLTPKNLWKKMQKHRINASKLVLFPSSKSNLHVETGSLSSTIQSEIEPSAKISQPHASKKIRTG